MACRNQIWYGPCGPPRPPPHAACGHSLPPYLVGSKSISDSKALQLTKTSTISSSDIRNDRRYTPVQCQLSRPLALLAHPDHSGVPTLYKNAQKDVLLQGGQRNPTMNASSCTLHLLRCLEPMLQRCRNYATKARLLSGLDLLHLQIPRRSVQPVEDNGAQK
jgi:hypothetical protein